MLRFKQMIREDIDHEQMVHQHVNDFMRYAQDYLALNKVPRVELVNNRQAAKDNTSFGGYYPGEKKIQVNIADRHPVDVLRTLAHELVHHRQDIDGKLKDVAMAGETGSNCENEANSEAGVMMRNYGRSKPSIYENYKQRV